MPNGEPRARARGKRGKFRSGLALLDISLMFCKRTAYKLTKRRGSFIYSRGEGGAPTSTIPRTSIELLSSLAVRHQPPVCCRFFYSFRCFFYFLVFLVSLSF